MIDTFLFLVIALILFSTKVFSIFMERLHMPQVIGALAAGIILGPGLIGLIWPNEIITVMAEIGVILLLFSAGMETDFRELRKSLKASVLVSIIGLTFSLGGGFAISLLFGVPTFESFFVGVIIASMSTSITVETLMEMGKFKTKSGAAIMGASLFDDVFVIVLLAVIMGGGDGGFTVGAVGFTLLRIVIFFAFALVAGIGISKLFDFLNKKFARKRRLAIFALAYCFLMAYLAEFLGLAGITGAYLAGIAFCSTRCADYVESRTHHLSALFFTPIFLTNIGLQVSFAAIDSRILLFTLTLAVIAIVTKVIGCGLGAKISGLSNRESLEIGTSMIARGEVSFIVAAKGMLIGVFSPELLPSIVIVTLITVFVAPILMKLAFREERGKRREES